MAEERRSKGRGRPPKYTGGTDKQGRSGSPLSIRIDPELRELVPAFQALFKRQHDVKLDLTDVVEMALTRLFREFGLLPPDGGAQTPPARPDAKK